MIFGKEKKYNPVTAPVPGVDSKASLKELRETVAEENIIPKEPEKDDNQGRRIIKIFPGFKIRL